MPPPLFVPLSREVFNQMVDYFREHPEDVRGCARALGLDYRTCKRGWYGPAWSRYGWSTEPIKDTVQRERRRAEEARVELEGRTRRELQQRASKAEELAEEAERIDADTLRLARNNVMAGLGHLARLNEGIAALANRVGGQLARGTDAKGVAIDINPINTLRIISAYTKATQSMVSAVDTLVGVTRIQKSLPTVLVGVQGVAGTTIEDAEAELGLAMAALIAAKRLGLASRSDRDVPGEPVTFDVPDEAMPPDEFVVRQ